MKRKEMLKMGKLSKRQKKSVRFKRIAKGVKLAKARIRRYLSKKS